MPVQRPNNGSCKARVPPVADDRTAQRRASMHRAVLQRRQSTSGTGMFLEVGGMYGEACLTDPSFIAQEHDLVAASEVCEAIVIDRQDFVDNFIVGNESAFVRPEEYDRLFCDEHAHFQGEALSQQRDDFLSVFTFFRQMPLATRKILSSKLRYKTFPAEHVIAEAGRIPSIFVFMLGGELKLVYPRVGLKASLKQTTKYLNKGEGGGLRCCLRMLGNTYIYVVVCQLPVCCLSSVHHKLTEAAVASWLCCILDGKVIA